MKQKLKRIGIEFIRIGVGVGIIFFLLKQVDLKKIIDIVFNINLGLFLFAFVVYIFSTYLCLYRWQMFLAGANVKLSLKRTAISFLTGLFFNLFLPSAIGGDVIRTMHLSGHTKKPKEVTASVFIDRVSGCMGLVLITIISVLVGGRHINDTSVFILVAILFFLSSGGLLVIFNNAIYKKISHFLHQGGKIRDTLKEFHQEVYLFKHRPHLMVNSLIISLLVQLSALWTFYILAKALNYHIDFIYFLVFVPIVSAISMLPISIGGLGVREASLMFFFSRAGLSGEHGFILSLLVFFFTVIIGIFGGLIYVIAFHPRWLQHNKAHQKV